MANFEQHVNGAIVASGVMVVSLHSLGVLDKKESMVAIFLGLVGGVLPDLDLDSSKPIQIAFKLFSVIIPILVLLGVPYDMSIVKMLVIWGVSSLILHFVFFKIFLTLTSHRGIFHTIPMGIFFAQITTVLFYYFLQTSAVFSTMAGFFVFLGFMVHLLLDEIFSVNITGLRMKKSFGTALKFYSKNNLIGTYILYGLIIVTYFITPSDSVVFESISKIIQNHRIL
jgi:membrane-bound metal-dependent hydrolase YbcI (DUF457 family)